MKSAIVAVGIVCGMGGALMGTVGTAAAQEPKKLPMKQEFALPSSTAGSREVPTTTNLSSALAGEEGRAGASAAMLGSAGVVDAKAGQLSVEKARSK